MTILTADYMTFDGHGGATKYVDLDRAQAAVDAAERERDEAREQASAFFTNGSLQLAEVAKERDEARAQLHEWEESDAASSVLVPVFTEEIARITKERDEARAQLAAAQRENARLREIAERSKEIVNYVADTLPMRNIDAGEPSSFPMMRCWVSESMVVAARDIQATLAPKEAPNVD
jgi:vacuolar-type H+-ATPase subunit I/STV1